MTVSSLAHALAASAAGPLLAQVERNRRIAQTLAAAMRHQPLAPDFDALDPQACVVIENQLLLYARSAAQAAKLRQSVPGLLRLLHQQGEQLNQIQIRVQPDRMSEASRIADPAQAFPSAPDISRGSTSSGDAAIPAGLRELAAELADDPADTPLRRAARRLQQALAGRR